MRVKTIGQWEGPVRDDGRRKNKSASEIVHKIYDVANCVPSFTARVCIGNHEVIFSHAIFLYSKREQGDALITLCDIVG